MDIINTAICHFTQDPAHPQPSRSLSDWQTINGKDFIVLGNLNGPLAIYAPTNTDDEVEPVNLTCPDCGDPIDYSRAVVNGDGRLYCGQ